jgi:glutamate N-acetyltransferase/amino-acid N-acetyltransferase
MPVNYTPPTADALLPVPGIVLGAAAAHIKNWDRDDVLLVVAEPGTVASGVFTQNRFCAAPVTVCRDHLAAERERALGFRALVVNAGNANAGTGESGLAAAKATCEAVATLLRCEPAQVLPFSTGVIMEPLPVERIVAGLSPARAAVRDDGWFAAARAIMTTDTVPKVRRGRSASTASTSSSRASRRAPMVPRHGDDARIHGDRRASCWRRSRPTRAPEWPMSSFNGATVDGDTSTNDSFVITATGKAAIAPLRDAQDPRVAVLRGALEGVAVELAQAIVRDGEGATKFIAIRVEGGRDAAECRRVGFGIAHSPLVKTAFFASDPNLGRIVCAIGNAGPRDLDPATVSFWLDDVLVVNRGGRSPAYTEEQGQRVMKQAEITVRVDLGRGHARATVWTCDFSHDYVTINAEYRS